MRRTVYGQSKKDVQDELSKLHESNRTQSLVVLKKMKLGEYLDSYLGRRGEAQDPRHDVFQLRSRGETSHQAEDRWAATPEV